MPAFGNAKTMTPCNGSGCENWTHLVVLAGGGGTVGGAKDSVRAAFATEADGGKGSKSLTSSGIQHGRSGFHPVHHRLPSVFNVNPLAERKSQPCIRHLQCTQNLELRSKFRNQKFRNLELRLQFIRFLLGCHVVVLRDHVSHPLFQNSEFLS
jgi:hypothetical protein